MNPRDPYDERYRAVSRARAARSSIRTREMKAMDVRDAPRMVPLPTRVNVTRKAADAAKAAKGIRAGEKCALLALAACAPWAFVPLCVWAGFRRWSKLLTLSTIVRKISPCCVSCRRERTPKDGPNGLLARLFGLFEQRPHWRVVELEARPWLGKS